MKRRPEIVILSGARLGSDAARASELVQYLKSIRPATLVLNGGLFDMQGRSLNRFPKSHLRVLRHLLKMAADGVRVWYVAADGDRLLGSLGEFSLGQMEFRERLVVQLGGVKYLIHPGQTDAGPGFFEGGKRRVRSATGWKSYKKRPELEENAIRLAQEAGCAAVVCGNPFRPKIHETDGDVQYLNSGVWSENVSALEFSFGKWTLFTYHPADFEVKNPKLTVEKEEPEEVQAFRSEDWSVYQTGQ